MTIYDLLKKNKEITSMTTEDLYKKHKNDPQDGGPSFHGWQVEILGRISEKIADDEEALVLFDELISFANMKACCAGD